jgi:hypothetical protein
MNLECKQIIGLILEDSVDLLNELVELQQNDPNSERINEIKYRLIIFNNIIKYMEILI